MAIGQAEWNGQVGFGSRGKKEKHQLDGVLGGQSNSVSLSGKKRDENDQVKLSSDLQAKGPSGGVWEDEVPLKGTLWWVPCWPTKLMLGCASQRPGCGKPDAASPKEPHPRCTAYTSEDVFGRALPERDGRVPTKRHERAQKGT